MNTTQEEERSQVRRVAKEVAASMGMEEGPVENMVWAALRNSGSPVTDEYLATLCLNYEYVPTGKPPDHQEERAGKRERQGMQPWRRGHA